MTTNFNTMLHPVAKAKEIAAANTASEDEGGWTYEVFETTPGFASVMVFDEDGFNVGNL